MEPTWRSRAACWGQDSAVFYPTDLAGVLDAKTICRDCPVIEACLEHAVTNAEFGVWGGTSEDERGELYKARARGFLAYHQALQAQREQLGRQVSGFDDERPWQEASTCPRCGARVPAGRWPPDRNGPGATCGRPATYNKGCRCDWCRAAKARYQAKDPDPAD